MPSIKFTKMHGLGNDFMVTDNLRQTLNFSIEDIKLLADRHLGVGFDQLLIVEKSTLSDIDFFYRIFNADGSEVNQCGNGARCIAKYIQDKGLCEKKTLNIATHSGTMRLFINEDKTVSVELSPPLFHPSRIPIIANNENEYYSFYIENEQYDLHTVNVGNPHGLLFVSDYNHLDLNYLGKTLSEHPSFPLKANISFVVLENNSQLTMKTYERGVGLTNACGSAACAAAVCAIRFYHAHRKIAVIQPGGQLSIYWQSDNDKLVMTGPAISVYDGEINH